MAFHAELEDFAAFYERTYPGPYRTALAIVGDPGRAADVTQTPTSTPLATNHSRGDAPSGAWFHRILVNAALTSLRHRASRFRDRPDDCTRARETTRPRPRIRSVVLTSPGIARPSLAGCGRAAVSTTSTTTTIGRDPGHDRQRRRDPDARLDHLRMTMEPTPRSTRWFPNRWRSSMPRRDPACERRLAADLRAELRPSRQAASSVADLRRPTVAKPNAMRWPMRLLAIAAVLALAGGLALALGARRAVPEEAAAIEGCPTLADYAAASAVPLPSLGEAPGVTFPPVAPDASATTGLLRPGTWAVIADDKGPLAQVRVRDVRECGRLPMSGPARSGEVDPGDG